MKAIALCELIRPLNCVMAAIGVFIGYSIAIGSIGVTMQLGIAMLAAFLVCGAGQAINDFFDSEIDAKKNLGKPIHGKRISKKSALYYSLILFLIGNILAIALPLESLAIAVFFSIVLILYSAKMGKVKYIGNWIVALGTAFTLVFGASLTGNYGVIVWLAGAALLANVAREIIKDAHDLEADKGSKVSLPMILGRGSVKLVVFCVYIAAIALGFYAHYIIGFGGTAYLVLLTIASLIFILSWLKFAKTNYRHGQKLAKIGMLIALIAFIAGVF
ncbi:MAG: UbiA family prenyltransferase [Candidatus Diapherotrites archaeon]|nr:UbiA family prenyltransferase [Candidatus Diapherotrites archaeon]